MAISAPLAISTINARTLFVPKSTPNAYLAAADPVFAAVDAVASYRQVLEDAHADAELTCQHCHAVRALTDAYHTQCSDCHLAVAFEEFADAVRTKWQWEAGVSTRAAKCLRNRAESRVAMCSPSESASARMMILP